MPDPAGPPPAGGLSFTVDDDAFTLPALDTRTWLDALALQAPGCWWNLIPGQLDEHQADRFATRLRTSGDPFDLDDAEEVAVSVLSAALAMDFWAASRLAAAIYGSYLVFSGWSYTRGMNPLHEPITHVLAASYVWRAQSCEKDSEVTRLDHDIWSGPPSVTAFGRSREALPTWATGGREEAAFDQFAAMFGGHTGAARG